MAEAAGRRGRKNQIVHNKRFTGLRGRRARRYRVLMANADDRIIILRGTLGRPLCCMYT